MSTVTLNKAWQDEALKALQKDALHPDLADWQKNALDKFIAEGFPTRKNENWKYTNVSAIGATAYTLTPTQVNTKDLTVNKIKGSHHFVFVNGELRNDLSSFESLPPGVIVSDLKQTLNNEKWRKYIEKLDKRYATVFSDLNAALMTSGIFIYVPKNIILENPIHFSYLTLGQTASMSHPRHLILLEVGSQCTVVEEYSGDGADYFNNIVSQIVVKSNAIMTHFKLQNESLSASHIANTLFNQSADSTVSSYVVSMGSKLSRENLSFNFEGQGASTHLYGLYLPLKDQHIDHHTRVDHLVPNCFSQQDYKGIIAEKGHAVFNGKVIVHSDAQKTAAYQNNQNLLLSKNAEIDTKPELEIYADDVKCSHGATVGQLDEKALFYLRSRGIAKIDARRMLTKAFAEELFSNIMQQEIAKYIHCQVEAKLASI